MPVKVSCGKLCLLEEGEGMKMKEQSNENTSKLQPFLEHGSKQPASNLKPSPNNPPTKLSPVTPTADSGDKGRPTKS